MLSIFLKKLCYQFGGIVYLYIAINAHTLEPWDLGNYFCLFNLLISDKDILKPLPNDSVANFAKM